VYWFTIFAPKQVLTYKGGETEDSFSILVSNVFQPNRKSELLINLVNKYKPDLFLVLEADKWWDNQLRAIESDYEYKVKKPQDNLYGMILYSKLELSDQKINFLFEDDIPSFEAMVKLNNLAKFKIYCLHPRPPFPTESETSTNRDAELLVVGKKVEKHDSPVIIFGDFNDVAWSNTTRLFQKISELLDPRIGRGFYNSFHAGYALFRWSLDHVFHSTHFQLMDLKRLGNIGSDHFPIYIKLHYKPEEKELQEEPEANEEELELADEKIETAREEN
ncbi:MAG TPA: endonuclease/exonuclease/phosphatase family protein, partial [Mariniphaga sp.]|nr:endonuclease/exonuclease/phosphatase family protein [Mariniphaga sp.]